MPLEGCFFGFFLKPCALAEHSFTNTLNTKINKKKFAGLISFLYFCCGKR